jgi:hypothetical protein
LAKIVAPDFNESQPLTAPDEIFGSVPYMAPEQIEGNGAEARIDLYALGIIAYEIITGRPPFSGRQMQVLRAHQLEAPPPPSSLREMPAQLEALILRCLAKKPADRFDGGSAVQAALEAVPGYESESKRRRRSLQVGTWEGEHTDPHHDGFALTEALERAEGETLGQALQALLDQGAGSTDLVIITSKLRMLEEEAAQLERGIDETERSAEEAYRLQQSRLASVRMALSDLYWQRRENDSPALGREIERLERQLHELAGRDEKPISVNDRRLELAIRHATVNEQILETHKELVRLLPPILRRVSSISGQALVDRIERLLKTS